MHVSCGDDQVEVTLGDDVIQASPAEVGLSVGDYQCADASPGSLCCWRCFRFSLPPQSDSPPRSAARTCTWIATVAALVRVVSATVPTRRLRILDASLASAEFCLAAIHFNQPEH